MQASDEKPLLCQNSKTCKQLVALVQDILGTKTAMKVLCFGLGELCRTAPEWLKKRHDSWDENSEDPEYTEVAEDILTKKGFKIVGTHGAGGFAEINEGSIKISPFAAALVKQIIADLARPVLIISTGFAVFNSHE
ncbi:unnamed protein product [Penicillium manginii]